MARISITGNLSIDESELDERFVHSTGPGGQNVNKVATAVQLRFNLAGSTSLPDETRVRLSRLAGHKLSKDGVLTIVARRFRTRERNREDALSRLIEMIREASIAAPPRRPTKLNHAVKERRLESKKKHSALKRARARPPINS